MQNNKPFLFIMFGVLVLGIGIFDARSYFNRRAHDKITKDIESAQGDIKKQTRKQIDLSSHKFRFHLESQPPAQYKISRREDIKTTNSADTSIMFEGITPFDQDIPGGLINIELAHDGFNTLSENVMIDKDTDHRLWLDPKGQVLHRLRDIDTGPSPKGAAFTPDGTEIWTTLLLGTSPAVEVFDPSTARKIAEIDLDGHGGVEVIFTKDGSKAYVSQMETNTIYEINAHTKDALRTFDTQSAWCKVMELSPDEKTLYVANWSGNNISEIDLETGLLRRLLPTVPTPRGLYATRDGKYLYVAGFENGDIERIDLANNENDIESNSDRTETNASRDIRSELLFTSGGAMRHFAADEEKGVLYASDMAQDVIWELDLHTKEVTKFADTDQNPNTIVLSPDRKVLYVSCRGKNAEDTYYIPGPEWGSVLALNTENGSLLDAIVGGNQPTALAVSQDGTRLVFSNFLDADLRLYEIPSFETLQNGNGGRSDLYRAEMIK